MSIIFGLLCIAFAIWLEWREDVDMDKQRRHDDDR